MIILASGATQHCRRFGTANLGGLLVPGVRSTAKAYLDLGAVWAADNGCFRGLDAPAFVAMLERNQPWADTALWVVVPDVFDPESLSTNARKTLERFHDWADTVAGYGYPLAFVAQNDSEKILDQFPWSQIRAVFLGGDTAWKLGPGAAEVARVARQKGKWVHMGRVNTQRRIYHAAQIGCNSIDGQSFSRFGSRDLPWALPQVAFYSLAYGI